MFSYCEKLKKYEGLMNEPVDASDDGHRVEIVEPRSPFLFEIEQISCSVTYRDVVYRVVHARVKTRPESMWKTTSNVSILTVYDTYGLDVALAFLGYLVKCCEYDLNGLWIQAYLYACLHIIRGDLSSCAIGCSIENARKLASNIELELRRLDGDASTVQRLESAPCDLPIEVLAKIINSVRVSKGIRAAVLAMRRDSEPNWRELHDTSLPCTSLSALSNPRLHYMIRGTEKQWNLFVDRTTGPCELTITELDKTWTSYPDYSFSVRAYARCMQARRCVNINERVGRVLDGLLQDPDCCLGAWIAQLSCELDQPEKKLHANGVRDELTRLIDLAKMVDWSHAPSAVLWS